MYLYSIEPNSHFQRTVDRGCIAHEIFETSKDEINNLQSLNTLELKHKNEFHFFDFERPRIRPK